MDLHCCAAVAPPWTLSRPMADGFSSLASSVLCTVLPPEACVAELQTRKTVTNAYRSGWRPATDGSLPTPATPALGLFALPATPTAMITTQPIALRADGVTSQAASSSSWAVKVFNTRRGKYHLVVPPGMKSMCDFWTCGSATRPTASADFDFNGPGSQCAKCFFR